MDKFKRGWVSRFVSRFKDKIFSRRKIIGELRALDELKEITLVGSALSEVKRKTVSLHNRSPKGDEIEEALFNARSHLYDNCLEAYRLMPKEIRDLAHRYANNHYKYKPQPENIDSLAISGGGGKGQFYIGALKGLDSMGVLKNINTFAGTSAGALCSLPLAMGMDIDSLDSLVSKSDFRVFFAESVFFSSQKKENESVLSTVIREAGENNNLKLPVPPKALYDSITQFSRHRGTVEPLELIGPCRSLIANNYWKT